MLAPVRNIRHIELDDKGNRKVTLFIRVTDKDCPGYNEKDIPKQFLNEFVPFIKVEKPKKASKK